MLKPTLIVLLSASLLLVACGDAAPEDTTPAVAVTEVVASSSETSVATDAPVETAPVVISDARVEAAHSPEMARCLAEGDAARGVTPAMAGCINVELQAQDARLNAAYGAAMATLDSAGQSRLRTEERAWIRQRDEECEALATGGTIDRIEIPSCLLNETIRRRLILEAMVP